MPINKEMTFHPAGVVINPLDPKEVEFWGHDAGEFAPAENTQSQVSAQAENTAQASTGGK